MPHEWTEDTLPDAVDLHEQATIPAPPPDEAVCEAADHDLSVLALYRRTRGKR